jgi:hypothetical protein
MDLTTRSRETLTNLLEVALDDVMDDPCYPDEVIEFWEDSKALCAEVGLDWTALAVRCAKARSGKPGMSPWVSEAMRDFFRLVGEELPEETPAA